MMSDLYKVLKYVSTSLLVKMINSAYLNENPATRASSHYTPEQPQLDEKFNVHEFTHVHSPKENIDYVPLKAINLAKFKEGTDSESVASRKSLAEELNVSLRTYGFFFVINHGIDEETFERINAIGQALHSVPEEEKIKFRSAGLTSDEDTAGEGAERGGGYKPLKYWGMANGVRDNISFFNYTYPVQDELHQRLPELAATYLNEVRNYFRYIHHNVLKKLTILCDIILELPEGSIFDEYFRVYQGNLKDSGSGFGRLMDYFGQTQEQNKLTDNTWLRGHSDSTAFTFIASQPMASLQVRDYNTGKWGYVAHVPNALVVNVGDGIEFLTGGYFRSTIHRVVNPPPSQENHIRQSIIYFCKTKSTAIIDPEALNSPYLHRLGISSPPEWERITYGDWDVEKGRLFGKSKVNNLSGDAPAPAYIRGRAAERWVPTLKT